MFRPREKIYRKESIDSLFDIIRSEPRTYEDDVLIYANPQNVITPILDYLFYFYDGVDRDGLIKNEDKLDFRQWPGIDIANRIRVNAERVPTDFKIALMIRPDGSFDTYIGDFQYEWTPGLDWAYVRNHHV